MTPASDSVAAAPARGVFLVHGENEARAALAIEPGNPAALKILKEVGE